MFIALFGSWGWAHASRADMTHQWCGVGQVLGATWASDVGSVLPPELAANQIGLWFVALKFPLRLVLTPTSTTNAINEAIRIIRYERARPGSRSELLAEVFDRVLIRVPGLKENNERARE